MLPPDHELGMIHPLLLEPERVGESLIFDKRVSPLCERKNAFCLMPASICPARLSSVVLELARSDWDTMIRRPASSLYVRLPASISIDHEST